METNDMSGTIPTIAHSDQWHTPHYRPWLIGVFSLLVLLLAACGLSPDTSPSAAGSGNERQVAAGGPATIAVESRLLEEASGAPLNVGDIAPDFSYTLPDGSTQRLSDLRGQKVMVNFWATWCPPCMAEMPDIQQAYEQYHDEGFMVLAVNRNEELGQISTFAQEMGLSIPLVADPAGNIGDAYGARNLPTTYFINTDGTIDFRKQGIMTLEFIEQRIEEMQ
jgi:peroxiredoxin